MVTIGDNPLSSFSPLVYLLPLHYYSHTVHPPHTHHNLLFPFLSVERHKNSTSHLSRGVQFRLSLMVRHFPRNRVFSFCLQWGYFLHPSQQAQASSFSLPCPGGNVKRWPWVEVLEIWGLKMAMLKSPWSRRSERKGDGFVATSTCTHAINKLKHWMSYKYSDSVSSCCGLQSSSTIDLVSWWGVRGNNGS